MARHFWLCCVVTLLLSCSHVEHLSYAFLIPPAAENISVLQEGSSEYGAMFELAGTRALEDAIAFMTAELKEERFRACPKNAKEKAALYETDDVLARFFFRREGQDLAFLVLSATFTNTALERERYVIKFAVQHHPVDVWDASTIDEFCGPII